MSIRSPPNPTSKLGCGRGPKRWWRCGREIAAILTADQRSKLADKIESKAERNSAGRNPSGGTQGTGTTYPQGTGTPGSDLNRVQQNQFIGGYGFGPIGGWGYGGGYGVYQSSTYVGGYPFIGGWGPGIW
jgi:hypothetical protein